MREAKLREPGTEGQQGVHDKISTWLDQAGIAQSEAPVSEEEIAFLGELLFAIGIDEHDIELNDGDSDNQLIIVLSSHVIISVTYMTGEEPAYIEVTAEDEGTGSFVIVDNNGKTLEINDSNTGELHSMAAIALQGKAEGDF